MAGLAAAGGFVGSAPAAGPAATLAQRYAPVVRLVAQAEPCGHGEPYEPTDVNVVLGNDGGRPARARGTTPNRRQGRADRGRPLATGLFGYHLDFPGDALAPGCDYEQWSQRITAGSPSHDLRPRRRRAGASRRSRAPVLVLLRLQRLQQHARGRLGDDPAQLRRRATPPAALDDDAAEVGYSQHEGAERAHWGDAKLELVDGTHPVVYPAPGSHANYFAPALYLGRSAAQGVGCDDTDRAAHARSARWSALVPSAQAAYLRRTRGSGSTGRWGEQQPGFYNGPTGPNTKAQWTAPFTWAGESWRDTQLHGPGRRTRSGRRRRTSSAARSPAGSNLLTDFVGEPAARAARVSVFALVLLVWLAVAHDAGTRSAPFRLGRRRPWGVARHLGVGDLPAQLAPVPRHRAPLRPARRRDHARPVPALPGRGPRAARRLRRRLERPRWQRSPSPRRCSSPLLGLTVVQAVTAAAMARLDDERPVTRARRLPPRPRPPLAAHRGRCCGPRSSSSCST